MTFGKNDILLFFTIFAVTCVLLKNVIPDVPEKWDA
jgi:hypothetical protein